MPELINRIFLDLTNDIKRGFYNKYYGFRYDEAVVKDETRCCVESKLYDHEIEEIRRNKKVKTSIFKGLWIR